MADLWLAVVSKSVYICPYAYARQETCKIKPIKHSKKSKTTEIPVSCSLEPKSRISGEEQKAGIGQGRIKESIRDWD